MLKRYLQVAIRNLSKNIGFSVIHILGLTIGVASCILIFQYVSFEISYDRFHEQAEDIYRVPIRYSKGFGQFEKTASNHPGLGPAMKSDFPEVKSFTRLLHPSTIGAKLAMANIDKGGQRLTFNENKIYLADSTFFSIFSFPFISGDAATALDKPRSIVLSADMATKYFGNDDPLNKTLLLNGREITVTGVMENVPANSHIDFDALLSFNTFFSNISESNLWIWPEFHTYVLLEPGTDPDVIESRFPAFTDRYMDAIHKEHNFRTYFSMQPLLDIHLKTDCANEITVPGSQRMVYFLTLLGVFILIIAWVNYINLSTSRSLERAREVGIRKVAGATKRQLVSQFLVDSTLVNGMSILLGLTLARILLPNFTTLVGKHIGNTLLSSNLLLQPNFWLILIGSILLSGLLAGIYPALVLSSFKPSQILKGSFYRSLQGISVRKMLVGFQFVLSILLIAATILVTRQLAYMNHEELGYTKDQILVVKAPVIQDSLTFVRSNVLKTELSQLAEVNALARSSEIPGKLIAFRSETRKEGLDREYNTQMFLQSIDDQFLPTFNIELAAGRNFAATDSSRIFNADNNKVLVNEVLAASYGFADPEKAVGQMIRFKLGTVDHKAEIIGVVKNYHQRSLKEAYDPILYYYPDYSNWSYYSINISSSDWGNSVRKVEEKFREIMPNSAFEYFFLDDFFDYQYQAEQRFGKVCGVIAGLAIFVACLGILGLSAITLAQRTKEIGMRRILGASSKTIMVLVTKDFIKILTIAHLMSLPLIVYFGRQWLTNFAFNSGLSWQIFTLPIVLLLLVVFMIVGVQIYRGTVLNPIESLRSQ